MSLTGAMRRAGKSAEDVAFALNVSPSAVSRWKNGTSGPPMGQLKSLAQCLNCKVDEILDEEGDGGDGV